MELGEWLQRLESLHPTEIEMGLGRVSQVARKLPLSNIAKRVITVAGTNGKGSTVEIMGKIIESTGLRVGSYTSPHLLRFNERIKVNSKPVSDAALCDAFARIDRARGDISLTYFEFSTLAALDLFARADLDVALLEVGLGGRLDATNIIDPDVAVITSIALDHQDWLGDTREAIGYEKAGIMRAGSPVVCGDPEPPLSVIHHAESLAAEFDCFGQQFGYDLIPGEQGELSYWDWWGQCRGQEFRWERLPVPELPLQNAATALQAVSYLRLPLTHEQLSRGLRQSGLAGRFQRLQQPVPMVLDVAHNLQAVSYLQRKITEAPPKGKVFALFGMLADKDYQAVIEMMQPVISDWACCDLPTGRSLSAEQLVNCIQAGGGRAERFSSVGAALDQLAGRVSKDDLLLVFGSFYTVSEALKHLEVSQWMTG